MGANQNQDPNGVPTALAVTKAAYEKAAMAKEAVMLVITTEEARDFKLY